jgi:hypothetical protein
VVEGSTEFEHRVTGETIAEEMTRAGYRVAESLDILPKQSFTLFHLKNIEQL